MKENKGMSDFAVDDADDECLTLQLPCFSLMMLFLHVAMSDNGAEADDDVDARIESDSTNLCYHS